MDVGLGVHGFVARFFDLRSFLLILLDERFERRVRIVGRSCSTILSELGSGLSLSARAPYAIAAPSDGILLNERRAYQQGAREDTEKHCKNGQSFHRPTLSQDLKAESRFFIHLAKQAPRPLCGIDAMKINERSGPPYGRVKSTFGNE
ncbi:hypothetical protein [Hyphomicrobium sp. LHD-15]|uniref:hypothetical protein n=1 Tax=Hyphomicrobium sp. LHD-15 TaxID=3072142 RepID=UPI00280F722B|nr:hypothetical protein [Hyphomicrobium sp. LHD-15]MDQ8699767.1 hypothetical protein [Hyphomicrobium sp. LHD-15]